MLARFERPNGLVIERVATPLGVVGVIFESRPNVTVDAGCLCVLAGNAAIDAALADPGDGAAVTTASVLVIARWVLLVLLLAVTGAVAVEALRRRSRTAGAPRQDPRSGQRG